MKVRYFSFNQLKSDCGLEAQTLMSNMDVNKITQTECFGCRYVDVVKVDVMSGK